MFKKYILILSVLFGISAIAETHADMSGESASGFSGAFELKYKADLSDKGNLWSNFTYRVRANWSGEVNDNVMWKLGLSSDLEQKFSAFELNNIYLEQAYVSHMLLDNLKVKVGKYGQGNSFARSGVLYDEDHYVEGVRAMYHDGMFKVAASLINLADTNKGPFSESALVEAKVSMKNQNILGVNFSASLGAQYDGLFKTGEADPVMLANAGLQVSVPYMGVPVQVVGVYSVNKETLLDDATYSVGVNFGNDDESVYGVNVGVNYYNINTKSWNTDTVNTDYVSKQESTNGIAAKVSVNVCEATDLVVKYVHDLAADENPHNLVGELTFNF